MASSRQLSKIHSGLDLASRSRKVDKLLFNLQNRVCRELEKKYSVSVIHESTVGNTELYDHLNGSRKRHVLESNRTGIRPDGGLLLVQIKKNDRFVRVPILISENKKQGTGKDQAMGNVIERLGKNIIFCQSWLIDEKIFPFVVFCYGVDFKKGSYIIDRVATMAHQYPANKVNLYKDSKNIGGVSWFYQKNKFSSEKVYSIIFEIAKKSLEYYDKKYTILKSSEYYRNLLKKDSSRVDVSENLKLYRLAGGDMSITVKDLCGL